MVCWGLLRMGKGAAPQLPGCRLEVHQASLAARKEPKFVSVCKCAVGWVQTPRGSPEDGRLPHHQPGLAAPTLSDSTWAELAYSRDVWRYTLFFSCLITFPSQADGGKHRGDPDRLKL